MYISETRTANRVHAQSQRTNRTKYLSHPTGAERCQELFK